MPLELKKLLERYHDIVDNGLPSAFPPMRDVSDQVDLIPREIFPNKVANKMTQSQKIEIAR